MVEQIPTAVGRYRTEAVIGRGAMGVIYRAHDPMINRHVAIKLIATDILRGEEGKSFLQRFQREAKAAGRCIHPNIVTVYDYGIHEGFPFIVMEFVDGLSLRQAVGQGRLFTLAESVHIVQQVLEALSCAHAAGVIHRDIKPSNILLRADNRVKLADFGISRIDSSDLTGNGELMGTPGYMSPEQCEGHEVDGRTDIFSTAAVLYELVTGLRAFPGRGFAEVRRRIVIERNPELPCALATSMSNIGKIISRGLAKRLEDRFSTAADMAEAIRAASASADLASIQSASFMKVVPPVVDKMQQPEQVLQGILGPDVNYAPMESDVSGLTHYRPGTLGVHGSDLLNLVEQALLKRVGPIARVLVRRAAVETLTAEALCDMLAKTIPDAADRQSFLADMRRVCGSRGDLSIGASSHSGNPSTGTQSFRGGSSGAWRVDGAEVERAQRALALHVGPISKVLARRAAAEAKTVDDLWNILARQIDDAIEREKFERRRWVS